MSERPSATKLAFQRACGLARPFLGYNHRFLAKIHPHRRLHASASWICRSRHSTLQLGDVVKHSGHVNIAVLVLLSRVVSGL